MIVFDRSGFRAALANGLCDPPCLLTPLVRVSRRSHRQLEDLQERSLRDHYVKTANRMTSASFGHLRVGADRAIRAAPDYFPAYEFHVGELINDEWLSAVDWHKEFHRDHISHQLMCVYVGRTLLAGGHGGEFMFDGRPLLELCLDAILHAPECEYLRDYLSTMGAPSIYQRRDGKGRHAWRQLFLESLFLSCMYHDIGYPWQFVHCINDRLRPYAPENGSLGDGADGIYEQYRHRLVMYPFNGYQPLRLTQPVEWSMRARTALKVGFARTHGVPGAFAFLHLNDILREYPRRVDANAPSRFCTEWAAMAIAMHDLQKIYAGDKCAAQSHLRVCFNRDPLSFVLTLIDQIQDFGRPSALFERHGNVILNYRASCHRVEIEPSPGMRELTITSFYSDKNDAKMNIVKCKPEAEEDFFNIRHGYLDGSALPMPRVRLRAIHDPDGHWW